jgi:hypothetical protein
MSHVSRHMSLAYGAMYQNISPPSLVWPESLMGFTRTLFASSSMTSAQMGRRTGDPGTVGPTQVVHTIQYNMTLQKLYNTKFNLYPGAISFFQYPYT